MLNRYRCIGVLVLLVGLLLCVTAEGGSAPAGTVSGRVTNQGVGKQYVWVYLYTPSGDVDVYHGQTNANGDYSILNITPGKYFAKAAPMSCFEEWWNEASTRADADTIDVTAGNPITGINFTVTYYAYLEGRVWAESDSDGVYEDGEVPVAGDTVRFVGGEIDTFAVTRDDGVYYFTEVMPGITYSITLSDTGLDHGRHLYGDNPILWTPADVSGENNCDANFAIIYPPPNNSTIGIAVIDDANGNGIWDANESGIRAVEVWLKGSKIDGYDGQKLVNSNGMTSFPKLMSQECVVGVNEATLPAGYTSTNGGSIRKSTPPVADEVTVVFLYSKTKSGDAGQSQEPSGNLATNGLPTEFALAQNYPNPFNPTTAIHYDLIETSNVNLTVFDANGRIVATLVNGITNPGHHTAMFNASAMPSGTYYYKIVAGKFTATKRMILVK